MKNPTSALRLQFLLDTHGLTAKELSEKIGVSTPSLSQYVNGIYAPSASSAEKIAAYFGVDPLWIRGFDVAMKPSEGAEEDQQIAQKLRLLTYANKLRILERIDMLLEQQEDDQ